MDGIIVTEPRGLHWKEGLIDFYQTAWSCYTWDPLNKSSWHRKVTRFGGISRDVTFPLTILRWFLTAWVIALLLVMLCFGRIWQLLWRIPAFSVGKLITVLLCSRMCFIQLCQCFWVCSLTAKTLFFLWLLYSGHKNAMKILTDLFLIAFLHFGKWNLLRELLNLKLAFVSRHVLLIGFTWFSLLLAQAGGLEGRVGYNFLWGSGADPHAPVPVAD